MNRCLEEIHMPITGQFSHFRTSFTSVLILILLNQGFIRNKGLNSFFTFDNGFFIILILLCIYHLYLVFLSILVEIFMFQYQLGVSRTSQVVLFGAFMITIQ